MIDINNNALGAVGEHQTLSRLLLLGYQAAITNLSVKNDESADILCRDTKGKFVAIQVKATKGDSITVGFSHKEFYDANGNLDMAKGKAFLEAKIVGPWVIVQVTGYADFPTFKFFILSPSQIRELIYDSEKWYLTGHNRAKLPNASGRICIPVPWLYGQGVPANSNHIEWINPFASEKFEDAWHNLWID